MSFSALSILIGGVLMAGALISLVITIRRDAPTGIFVSAFVLLMAMLFLLNGAWA